MVEPILNPQIGKSPLAYGVGNLGISILSDTFNGFIYFYYIDILGLTIAAATLVRTIYTVWDSLDDILMGLLSDRTRSAWGRRRPWLLAGFPLQMLVFFLAFSFPSIFLSPSYRFPYMLAITLLYETFGTITGLNYSALFPELFRTLFERSKAAVFSQGGSTIGTLFGLALSPIVFHAFGFSGMAAIYSISAGLLFFCAINYIHEDKAIHANQSNLRVTLHGILADRLFWLFITMMILALFSSSLIPFALPFYVKYSLHGPVTMNSLLSGLALLASLIALPLWEKLIKALEVHLVFLTALAGLGLAVIGFGLASGLILLIPSAIIFGISLGGVNVCNLVIRATMINRNIQRTNNSNEASYYGLLNSISKWGGLLQSLSMLCIGILFGYISGDSPGNQPGLAFRFLISVFPASCIVLSALVGWQFFRFFPKKTELNRNIFSDK